MSPLKPCDFCGIAPCGCSVAPAMPSDTDVRAALEWIIAFAQERSQDSQRVAAKVQSGAMKTIASRVEGVLAALQPSTAISEDRQVLFDELRRAWFAGRASGRNNYDSEAVEEAWQKQIDAILVAFARETTPPVDAGVKGDFRLNLARALFEASYGYRLCAWSDETQAFWLARADDILFDTPTASEETVRLEGGAGYSRGAPCIGEGT